MYAVLTFPDLSPDIFSVDILGFNFVLRWYALAYIIGILIAWRMGVAAVRCPHLWAINQPPMDPRQIGDLLTWIILGVIIGGRLGFVLFYQPAFYLQNPGQIPQIWHGGMAFHGGLLGVLIASLAYTRRHGLPQLSTADLIAHTIPPGLFLGRVANFINAELWGRPSEVPWAVVFPGELAQYCPGIVGTCARHPSQLYEALLEGLILGALLLWMVYYKGALRWSGMVCGTFFAGYGIGRFIVEFFRQPDPQFISEDNPLGLAWHINGIGLTMGQILSLPMIAIGLWLILRAKQRAHA